MERFYRWVMRHAPWIVLVSLALTAVSAIFAVHLYENLRTDFEELLPREARSVRDLEQVENRMESTESLAILVFSDHPDASKRFVDDLAAEIPREAGKSITRVEYRIDREIRFFKRRRALMMDLRDLRKVRDYVRDRLEYEREIRNPLNIFSGVTLNPPMLNTETLTQKYAGRVADYAKFKDGYYEMNGGRIRAVLVYVSGRALGVANALAVRQAVDRAIARLGPRRYAPDIALRFTGDVENLIEERDSLIADLELSTVIVAVLVMLAMLIYFRNALGTLALIASLFAGTIWTFGAAYFVVGYLNANSAFLGSIVLGNGINFGILFLARYLEERGRLPHAEALLVSAGGTRAGTLTAALAAGFSYGSLSLTSFRGFRQFGVIGLMGMVLCWIAAYTLQPALLTVLERLRPIVSKGQRAASGRRRGLAHLSSRMIGRNPRAVLAAGALITVALGLLALRHQGPILETDTSRLRDRRSMEKGSGYLSTAYLDKMFGRYLSPLVILPRSRDDTREIAARLRALQSAQGGSSLISNVYTIDTFVPRRQMERIRLLREIRAYLKPSVVARLSPKDARLAREYLTPEAFRPFGLKDLPPQIRARFRERDGSVGRPLLVEPVFSPKITHEFTNQKALIDEVRATADGVEPGAPVVGQLPLTVDMIASIRRDGPRATAFAFLSVTLLAVILFRRLSSILEALFALLLGVTWMACAALALDIKVNFLNFIAFPITFGIGVDYGVNILTRARREGADRIMAIVARTGGAVTLASLTTIIGYSSLLIAGNRGFVSFGRLAVLGEITCLSAAVFMLPAYLRWRALRAAAARGERRERTEEPRRAA